MAQLVRHLIAPTRVFARPAVRASLAALVLLVMTVLPAAAAATGVVALASGSASPTSGTPSTVITFSVVYTNTDSKAPAYVRLHVAGKTLAMFPASGDGWKRPRRRPHRARRAFRRSTASRWPIGGSHLRC